jgi:predicted AAA+ superfamily ATPase
MSTLKAWRQVVTPHADIRSGKFDSSVFAADLGEVLAGRGAVDYRDAATFFAKTHMTNGITRLLIEVMQRLSGSGKTEPVIQLQTPFGGGKTHSLLTLYHTLKKPAEVGKLPQIKALLDAAAIKNIPTANVACLVGTALNAASDRTFWGEMAYQLGGERLYQMVAKNDQTKTAPGSTKARSLSGTSSRGNVASSSALERSVKSWRTAMSSSAPTDRTTHSHC